MSIEIHFLPCYNKIKEREVQSNEKVILDLTKTYNPQNCKTNSTAVLRFIYRLI